ncbi:hypothetical protein AAMO2058_000169700 [Amorphochlora amoebiformis]
MDTEPKKMEGGGKEAKTSKKNKIADAGDTKGFPPKYSEARRRRGVGTESESIILKEPPFDSGAEIITMVHANVLGLLLAAGIAMLVYYNYILWQDYLDVFAWSFLACQALYNRKNELVRKLRKYQINLTSEPKFQEEADDDDMDVLDRLFSLVEVHPYYILGGLVFCFLAARFIPWLPSLVLTLVIGSIVFWIVLRSTVDLISLLFTLEQAAEISIEKFKNEFKNWRSGERRRSSDEGGGTLSASDIKRMIRNADRSASTLVDYAPMWFLMTLIASAVSTTTSVPFVVVSVIMMVLSLSTYHMRSAILRAILPLLKVFGLSNEVAASLILSFGTLMTIAFILLILILFASVDIISAITAVYGSAKAGIDNAASGTDFSALIANLTASASDGIGSAYTHFEESYNKERWWPVAEGIYEGIENGVSPAQIINSTLTRADSIYSNETWWEYVERGEDMFRSAEAAFAQLAQNNSFAEDFTLEKLSEMSFHDMRKMFSSMKGYSGLVAFLSQLGEQLWEQISVYASYLSSYVMANAAVILSSVVSGFLVVWEYISVASGQVTWAVLLCYFVNTLLSSDKDYLSMALDILFPGLESDIDLHESTASVSDSTSLSKRLRTSIEAVLWLPIEIACLNTSLTLISFHLLGFPFVYLAGILALIMSLVRVLDDYSYLFVFPWALGSISQAYWTSGQTNSWEMYWSIFRSIMLLGLHYWGQDWVQSIVIDKRRGSIGGGLLTDLSVGLGLVAFGAKGIILGPLLTSIFVLALSELSKARERNSKPLILEE